MKTISQSVIAIQILQKYGMDNLVGLSYEAKRIFWKEVNEKYNSQFSKLTT